MMVNQLPTDLFSQPHIIISGNPLLQNLSNHILELIQYNSDLLKGDKVGEINRKVTLAIYLDSGLRQAIGSLESFSDWFLNSKLPTEEEIARALRYLVQHDFVRLSSKAIQNAELYRQRITRSMKR